MFIRLKRRSSLWLTLVERQLTIRQDWRFYANRKYSSRKRRRKRTERCWDLFIFKLYHYQLFLSLQKLEIEVSQVAETKRKTEEESIDTAPIVTTEASPPEGVEISAEELRGLSEAFSSLKSDNQLKEERAHLEELKEDREEYREVMISLVYL